MSTERERLLPSMADLITVIAAESPEFSAWRNAQPDKYWKNWELSAIRIGYELGLRADAGNDATIERLTIENAELTKFRTMINALAMCGSAQSWAALSDSDKQLWFAAVWDESSRRKEAETQLATRDAELAELRKDAARYRWLKDEKGEAWVFTYECDDRTIDGYWLLRGPKQDKRSLDEAIDAAITAAANPVDEGEKSNG